MLKVVRGNEITYEDAEKLLYIKNNCKDSSYNVSKYATSSDYVINYYHLTEAYKSTIIIGDDWYLSYNRDDISIYFDEFYALPSMNNKRVMEMMSIIRNLLDDCKGLAGAGIFKHNTTYKFYTFLVRHGYLTEVTSDIIFEIDDEDLETKLIEEYQEKKKIEDEYYHYLEHEVGFIIGGYSTIKDKEIKKRQMKWIKSQNYI